MSDRLTTTRTDPKAGPVRESCVAQRVWRGRHRWALWLMGLAFIAGSVRMLHWLDVRDSPRWQVLIGDAGRYHDWACDLAAGNWIGTETFYQAPLYPYVLGLVYSVVGPDPIVARGLLLVLGVFSCILLAAAGRRLFGAPAGWIAGLLLALWPAELFHETLLEKSGLTTFLVCLFWWLAAITWREPRRLCVWCGLGVTVGLLSLVRENALLMSGLVGLWALWHPRSRSDCAVFSARHRGLALACVAMGFLIPLGPVLLRNRLVGGDWRITTAQFGPNFYIGNSIEADGTYHELVPERGVPEFEQQDATDIAEQQVERELSPGEVSRWWTERTLLDIREQPLSWVRLLAQKLALTWSDRELADSEDQYSAAAESRVLRWLGAGLSFGVLATVSAMSLMALPRQFLHCWIVPAVLILYTLSVAMFYVFARYRLPLVPPLALVSGAGLAHFAARLSQRRASLHVRRWVAPLAAGTVVGIVTLPSVMQPLFRRWPDTSIASMRAATEFNLALRFWEQSAQLDVVELHFARAIEFYPEYASAWLYWGYVLRDADDLPGAATKFARAAECDPLGADIRRAWGDTLLRLGRTAEARTQLALAVAGDAEDDRAREAWGRSLYQAGDFSRAARELAIVVEHDPESIAARRLLAITLARLGRRAESDQHFETLLTLLPADHREARLLRLRFSRRR